MLAIQMVAGQIEREILIEAPIDVVWRAITEPDQIEQWFCADAALEQNSGGGGRMVFENGPAYVLEVVAFEPPVRLAYRWLRGESAAARPENSTLVTFTLHDEAGSTRLRVVESGFDEVDWTDAAKATYFAENSGGWDFYLGRLHGYARRLNPAPRE